MKSSYIVALFIFLIGGFFAWSFYTRQQAPTEVMMESINETSEVALDTTTIVLSEQNELGQSGEALISANGEGMAVVRLMMNGGTFSQPQPAHIHVGSCPNPGAVKYPLTNVVDGISETTLSVSYDELKSSLEKMAINVHKSATEASVYTACGDIN